MRRTSVNLPEDDYEALRRLAEGRREQLSDVLREAVRAFVGAQGQPRQLSFVAAGASGRADTSLRFEDALAEELMRSTGPAAKRGGRTASGRPSAPQAETGMEVSGSPSLSAQELEILQKVAYGASAAEVAEQLGVPQRAVKAHLDRIMEKLGRADRTFGASPDRDAIPARRAHVARK